MRLLAVPALADNLIWLLADDDGRALAVDPGESEPVEAALAERGWRLEAILLTHHHHDHIGGAAALAARHGADIVAPADDRIAIATRRVGDGDVVQAASTAFRVMAIPAHTRSHIAFVSDQHLFCGDTLFSLGCGRLFEGTPAQLHVALTSLAALPEKLRLCCGHEYTEANARFARAVDPDNAVRDGWMAEVARRRAAGHSSLPSTIAIERDANPFLRVDSPAIRASLRARGEDSDDAVQRLGALRRWKDGFA